MTGSDLASAAAGGILALVLVVVALTLAAVFGLPWLWELVRPWLHALTA